MTIGPLIDDRAVASMGALIEDAVARGARVLTGGTAPDGDGFFFEPTVLVDVQPGSDILREEIFGPVLAITTFATEDEAVAARQRDRVRPGRLRVHAATSPAASG